MDFSLSEICDMLAEKLEKYGQKRKLEMMSAALAEKKFKTSTPLRTRVKFNFKVSPIKTASPTPAVYARNTPAQTNTVLNDSSALVETRNTPVSARNGPVESRNTAVGARNEPVDAANSPVGARKSPVSARNTFGSARTTPRVQNPPMRPTPSKIRGRFSVRPRALVFEDSDEEINGDV
ncbi:uncharacterized protein LOC121734970 [Aricia agestis]|uniref:uncharacterized protein LOC121734970 n=1 Tax=Aricia agestis TaxID=91739 RepID=UPI001C2039DF|nr:uncharacterized protein LOC121734970 [Aricia agestis]